MQNEIKRYRETPLGEQLSVHLQSRAELRRSIPLFSFSLSALAKRFESDTNDHSDSDELQHA